MRTGAGKAPPPLRPPARAMIYLFHEPPGLRKGVHDEAVALYVIEREDAFPAGYFPFSGTPG